MLAKLFSAYLSDSTIIQSKFEFSYLAKIFDVSYFSNLTIIFVFHLWPKLYIIFYRFLPVSQCQSFRWPTHTRFHSRKWNPQLRALSTYRWSRDLLPKILKIYTLSVGKLRVFGNFPLKYEPESQEKASRRPPKL